MSILPPGQLLHGGQGEQPQEAPAIGPNQPAPLFEMGPFKGLDQWRSPLQMQDNYLTDMSMMVLDEVLGAIVNAQGRSNIATAFTAPVLGMDVLRPAAPSANTKPFLFVVDGNGGFSQVDYIGVVAKTAVTLPSSGWNSTAQTYMATLNHVMLICNGISAPIKIRDDWNTASPTATLAGIQPPALALGTADSGNAGNLNGTYRWRYTFQNGLPFGQESSPSPASDPVLTLTNHSATLTNIAVSSDPQVTQRNIYRLGGSIPEWRLVVTINDNTTTTFTDNTLDTQLGQLLVKDRSQPPAGLSQIVSHKGRIFGFIGPNLLFTLFNEPESWPVTFSLPVGDASPIIAVGAATGSPLVIWKNREAWILTGESLADFQLLRVWGVGIVGPRAWSAMDNLVIWLSNDGIRAAEPRGGTGGYMPWLIGTAVWKIVKNKSSAVKAAATMSTDGSRVLISFPNDTPPITYSLNARTGDYEREKQPWYQMYGIPKYGEWEKFPFQVFAPVSLFAGADPGFFGYCELETNPSLFDIRSWPNGTYTDLGGNIVWFFERKQVDKGSGMLVKRYGEVEIVAPVQTTGLTLTLTVTADDDVFNKQYTTVFQLDNGPVRIGLPGNIQGRYLTIRVSGSHNFQVTIDRIRVWGWIDHRYAATGKGLI